MLRINNTEQHKCLPLGISILVCEGIDNKKEQPWDVVLNTVGRKGCTKQMFEQNPKEG